MEYHVAAIVQSAGALAATGVFGVTAATFRRQLKDRQREQADHVAAWIGEPATTAMLAPTPDPGPTPIALENSSAQPVYQAVVTLVFITGRAPYSDETGQRFRKLLSIVPPGRWTAEVNRWEPGGGRHPGVEIAFTDRAGRHWLRRATGDLIKLSRTPLEHYGLAVPSSGTWHVPNPRE